MPNPRPTRRERQESLASGLEATALNRTAVSEHHATAKEARRRPSKIDRQRSLGRRLNRDMSPLEMSRRLAEGEKEPLLVCERLIRLAQLLGENQAEHGQRCVLMALEELEIYGPAIDDFYRRLCGQNIVLTYAILRACSKSVPGFTIRKLKAMVQTAPPGSQLFYDQTLAELKRMSPRLIDWQRAETESLALLNVVEHLNPDQTLGEMIDILAGDDELARITLDLLLGLPALLRDAPYVAAQRAILAAIDALGLMGEAIHRFHARTCGRNELLTYAVLRAVSMRMPGYDAIVVRRYFTPGSELKLDQTAVLAELQGKMLRFDWERAAEALV
ncbi:MAG: hypothetical protein PHT12_01530 [Patescibacteria group bacterium]|nr:hypothetical protein [Patescibacteria group bacterium]